MNKVSNLMNKESDFFLFTADHRGAWNVGTGKDFTSTEEEWKIHVYNKNKS